MSEYKGPKTYLELSLWHANRIRVGDVRVGQAFFNDFGREWGNSYNTLDGYDAFSLITDGLESEYPNFWSGL